MRIRVAHISLQFSDSNEQHHADIMRVFNRAKARNIAWVTGTEAGPGSGNTAKELVEISKRFGYKPWVPSQQSKGGGRSTDCWLAVREDLVNGKWNTGFLPAIPGSGELYDRAGVDEEFPKWGPKGLVTVSFDSTEALGKISIGVAHYLTGARDPKSSTIHKVNHWEWNEKLAEVIGDWAATQAKGRALAFYAGDQNMADNRNDQPQGDTFFGEKLTSLADELKKWENTGHGPIDVIASYNKDGRVVGHSFNVLNDREFPLHTDHFYMEGTFSVTSLKR